MKIIKPEKPRNRANDEIGHNIAKKYGEEYREGFTKCITSCVSHIFTLEMISDKHPPRDKAKHQAKLHEAADWLSNKFYKKFSKLHHQMVDEISIYYKKHHRTKKETNK